MNKEKTSNKPKLNKCIGYVDAGPAVNKEGIGSSDKVTSSRNREKTQNKPKLTDKEYIDDGPAVK